MASKTTKYKSIRVTVDDDVNPEEVASCGSRLSFSWMTPLMRKGIASPLAMEELYPLAAKDSSQRHHLALRHHWQHELAQEQEPSVARALWKTFGPKLMLVTLMKFIAAVAAFALPVLLNQLIQFMQKRSGQTLITNAWLGYELAGGFFAVIMLRVLLVNQYYAHALRIGVNLQSSLRPLVYEKVFRLSEGEIAAFGSGRVMNHHSTDVDNISLFAFQCFVLWETPLQVVVITGMLYYYLGLAAFAGLAVMVLVLLLCSVLMQFIEIHSREQYACSDKRVGFVRELLRGIRLTKCYAWEDVMKNTIKQARNKEVGFLFKVTLLRAVNSGMFDVSSVLVALTSFAVFAVLTNEQLTPALAFTSLSLFAMIQEPVTMLPMTLQLYVQTRISCQRLTQFLIAEEVENIFLDYERPASLPSNIAVRLRNADFSLHIKPKASLADEEEQEAPPDQQMLEQVAILSPDDPHADKPEPEPAQATEVILEMKNVTLDIAQNQLTMLVGRVGAGKTTLLNAILGEMVFNPQDGVASERTLGSKEIAYVPQHAWILNATIQENILFGSELDEDKLAEVLHDSCLDEDLTMFSAGLLTEVGERGITLSGGQRQRIAIARAIYSDKDIYIFDDPFSALDCNTGERVFERCLQTRLANKTRIVVTHALKFTPKADQIVVLEDMQVKESGTYTQLREQQHGIFSSFFECGRELVEMEPEQEPNDAMDRSHQAHPVDELDEDDEEDEQFEDDDLLVQENKEGVDGVLMTKEKRAFGRVKLTMYLKYIRACGPHLFVGSVVVFSASKLAVVGSSLWLADWTRNTDQMVNLAFFLGVYATFVVTATVLSFVARFLFSYGGMRASVGLHDGMLESVTGSPMGFFDVTPVGRLVNRFSNDLRVIDGGINTSMGDVLSTLIYITTMILAQCFIVPPLALVYLPMVIPLSILCSLYRRVARDLQRLENISKSPVYAHVDQSLGGIASIRICQSINRFMDQFYHHVDLNARAFFPNILIGYWLNVRIEAVAAIICLGVSLLIMSPYAEVDPSLGGLLLSFTMEASQYYQWIFHCIVELEQNMSSVERVEEYTHLQQEETLEAGDELAICPEQWPQEGEIVFDKVCLRYRPNLDLVLKDLSLHIKPGQRVGLCGRTGSGKSTILSALFRLVNYESGRISIDNVPITSLTLTRLRSKMAVLPQEPMLFAQTVRFNLDPCNQHSELEIWDALGKANLKETIGNFPSKLDQRMEEDGNNLSSGERQLFALARAILRMKYARILFLDEATASVDQTTDAFIQEKLRTEFAERTIIIIAHRLDSLMDADNLFVLKEGQVVQSGTPQELLHQEEVESSTVKGDDSEFHRLAAGDLQRLKEIAAFAHRAKHTKRRSSSIDTCTPSTSTPVESDAESEEINDRQVH